MPNTKNFAYSTVATAPSPATSGTSLVVASGEGARFPTASFKAVIWPAGVQPLSSNAEIVNVTAVSTDTLTITRAQESSSARTVIVGDQIAAILTSGQMPTGTVVGDTDTQTLSGKTLTAPKFADGGFLADDAGNEQIVLHKTSSAVNQVGVTNSATGNAVIVEAEGGDSNIHLVTRGKGNGLTKCSVLRQDDTSNAYKHNSVILSGWGVIAGAGTAVVSETVTFGITFAARPIVVLSPGGDHASTANYGDGGNAIQGLTAGKAHTIATTSFVAYMAANGNWSASNRVFYQWIAIGEL